MEFLEQVSLLVSVASFSMFQNVIEPRLNDRLRGFATSLGRSEKGSRRRLGYRGRP